MDKVALMGPMYSGKSTIAKALADLGYVWCNGGAVIKGWVLDFLHMRGINIPDEYDWYEQNKGIVRPLAQGIGLTITALDTNAITREAILTWYAGDRTQPVVYDNIRRAYEHTFLSKKMGFKVVRVETPDYIREARAAAKGVSRETFREQTQHPVEQEYRTLPYDFMVCGEDAIENIIDQIISS